MTNLFNQQNELSVRLESALADVRRKDERLALYEDEVSHLHEMIREFKRHRFGSKSERWESVEQMVFNEAEMLAKSSKLDDDDSEEESESKVDGHVRRRGKRKPLPDGLPREIQIVELPIEEQVAGDGTPLKAIGKEISEKLLFEPASLKVLEIHRIVYGVDSSAVKTAEPLPTMIPKGYETPGLLANIVMQKYGYGMPFYRQEDMYKRMGCEIPRSTQARWVIQAAEKCRPIWNIFEERLMASSYVSCDETWTQVLKEKGRKAESKSWMWVRANPSDEQKIILFDYDPHRSGDVAKRLFSDYRGALQVDGYAAYDRLEKQEGVIRLGCNMHGRRKFESAFKVGSKEGKSLGEEAIAFYGRLYDVERAARQMSFVDRHALRQELAVPIWKDFNEWADASNVKVPPKSKIGSAFHYFINERIYLMGYLLDGRYEMDNGFAERAITSFAVGRKNWLFADSEAGADASGLFYSLVVTAKINGNDPYQILKTLFEQVPLAKTIDDFEKLADLILTRPTAD